jgi:hypothetical protein
LAEAGTAARPSIDEWTARHLDRLAALEAGWAEAAGGATLLHTDLRDNNMLVRTDGGSSSSTGPTPVSARRGWTRCSSFHQSA